jgi:hypothetical protein
MLQVGQPMPEKMPEKSKDFIEAECLKAARLQIGRRHLERVFIGRTKPAGSGPNWEVLGFTPQLPPVAHNGAVMAIAPLKQKYALEP